MRGRGGTDLVNDHGGGLYSEGGDEGLVERRGGSVSGGERPFVVDRDTQRGEKRAEICWWGGGLWEF